MVEDITERKRALEAVIQSERLAVAGRLAGAMAHEINNPLQAIRSNLELVTEFELPPEEQQHYLEICNLELERLSEITQRVLGFVRPSRGEREVVPVGELVRRTLDLVNKQLEHSQVRTRVDVPDNLPPVDVAPGEMVQVLMNVIVNAVEAMGSAPDGVPEGATDGGEIHIAARSEGDNVVLTLENDGPPIPSQDLARVFEPFFSTKTQGSGMGLAISYQIVQQHGGTMHVENLRGGQGVRFTVVLPASDA
jgi:two-component system NtrC family sensor kinase